MSETDTPIAKARSWMRSGLFCLAFFVIRTLGVSVALQPEGRGFDSRRCH
jgi:hypothetical protein